MQYFVHVKRNVNRLYKVLVYGLTVCLLRFGSRAVLHGYNRSTSSLDVTAYALSVGLRGHFPRARSHVSCPMPDIRVLYTHSHRDPRGVWRAPSARPGACHKPCEGKSATLHTLGPDPQIIDKFCHIVCRTLQPVDDRQSHRESVLLGVACSDDGASMVSRARGIHSSL
jgi:hypothetical protein